MILKKKMNDFNNKKGWQLIYCLIKLFKLSSAFRANSLEIDFIRNKKSQLETKGIGPFKKIFSLI